jgi:hypothetical protein
MQAFGLIHRILAQRTHFCSPSCRHDTWWDDYTHLHLLQSYLPTGALTLHVRSSPGCEQAPIECPLDIYLYTTSPCLRTAFGHTLRNVLIVEPSLCPFILLLLLLSVSCTRDVFANHYSDHPNKKVRVSVSA